MLLFRDEEHVHRWCQQWSLPSGATLSLETGWKLANAWYSNRLAPEWRRRTPEEATALFTELGLTADFWRLAP